VKNFTTWRAPVGERPGAGPAGGREPEGRAQPGSQGRLCVKGRYGWDYAASPQRLTVPLIRRDGAYPKGALSTEVRGEMNAGDNQEDRGKRRRRKPGGESSVV